MTAPVQAPAQERELLNDRSAGAFLSFSVGKIRLMRAEDRARIAKGEPPTGPKWIVLGKRNVRYRRSDLLEWIAENCQERGCVEFANRGKTP